MADLMPDYHVEQQRLRMNMMNLRLQIERAKLEVMEMAARKVKALETIESSELAIMGLDEKLAELIQTHGEPSPEE